MLEEKNDNLQDADGNVVNDSLETTAAENQEITTEDGSQELEVGSNALETETIEESAEEVTAVEEAPAEEATAEEAPEVTEEATAENVVELTDEAIADDSPASENDTVISAIQEVNAEESEDESLKDRHDIPMLDYDTLSMEQLVAELGDLVVVDKVMSVKDHVEELKKAFLSKYYHFIDEKRDEFHAENPDTTEEFHYHFPLKVKFDQLYSQYRDKKNAHFKSLQNSLQTNLETRLAIVEELKNLVHSQDSIPVTLKKLYVTEMAKLSPNSSYGKS